jgi:hypothetical protein
MSSNDDKKKKCLLERSAGDDAGKTHAKTVRKMPGDLLRKARRRTPGGRTNLTRNPSSWREGRG